MADEAFSTQVPEDKRLLAAVCIIFSWIGGIILILMAENNYAFKFQGWQMIVLGIAQVVLGMVTCGILAIILELYFIYGAYLMYTTGRFDSPIAGWVKSTFAM